MTIYHAPLWRLISLNSGFSAQGEFSQDRIFSIIPLASVLKVSCVKLLCVQRYFWISKALVLCMMKIGLIFLMMSLPLIRLWNKTGWPHSGTRPPLNHWRKILVGERDGYETYLILYGAETRDHPLCNQDPMRRFCCRGWAGAAV